MNVFTPRFRMSFLNGTLRITGFRPNLKTGELTSVYELGISQNDARAHQEIIKILQEAIKKWQEPV